MAYEELRLLGLVSTQLKVDANSIKKVQILKRSIDARQRNVVINLLVKVYINEYPQNDLLVEPIEYQNVKDNGKVFYSNMWCIRKQRCVLFCIDKLITDTVLHL